jgi:hypothetical protein
MVETAVGVAAGAVDAEEIAATVETAATAGNSFLFLRI